MDTEDGGGGSGVEAGVGVGRGGKGRGVSCVREDGRNTAEGVVIQLPATPPCLNVARMSVLSLLSFCLTPGFI